jgi:dTDP-glucose 4,6-dehydratase
MNSDTKNIFIAGGAGFIGSNFIRYILGRYPRARILNYDKLTYSGNLDNLKDIEGDKRYLFVRGGIDDEGSLKKNIKEFQPDYIINFAAETHVDRSIHVGAKEFIDTNVIGVFNLLEAAKSNPKVCTGFN